MTQQRVRYLSAFAAALVVSSLSYGCAPGPAGALVSLPVPRPGDVTFYLSLPSAPVAGLYAAARSAATPGSSEYRRFSSLDQAAHPFGATDTQINTGTPLSAACSSPLLQQRRVYTPQQVQTAYGVDTLRDDTTATPVITIVDLGGGWLPNDLTLAGQCFGLHPTTRDPDTGRRRRDRDQ
jgi:subtilase family serine protease